MLQIINIKFLTQLAVLLILALTIFMVSANSSTGDVAASTESELRATADQLAEEEAKNQAILDALSNEADTLANRLAFLNAEVDQLNLKIKSTKVEIKKLRLELIRTQKELDRQKAILAENLRTLYIEGNITTLDLILASEEFADFIAQQEYLTSLKNSVQNSADEVQQLKEGIQANKKKKEKALSRQNTAKQELVFKQREQRQLLAETRQSEAVYQAKQTDIENKRQAAEDALNDYLASLVGGNVNLGPINEGEYIGNLGNSGYSTGPHVHFKVYTASTVNQGVNPLTIIEQKNWTWPVGGGGGYISQDWGCTSWGSYTYYNGCSWHSALDIAAPLGTPLYATGSGHVSHRGCLYTGSIFSTYGVIIDHENGYYSLYIHMQAPDIPAYDACRANTYY